MIREAGVLQMPRPAFYILGACLISLNYAHAADPSSGELKAIVERHATVSAVLVPDCRQGHRPRLLSCAVREALVPYAEESAFVLDAPPRVRRPYLRIFSWPYGN